MTALRHASEVGKISPLMLAKVEKLLGASEKVTDRNQILRSSKNLLTR